MLIVDFYTLDTVNLLNFTQYVILYGTYAEDSYDIMRIFRTFCDFFTLYNNLTFLNLDSCISRYRISL